MASMATEAHLQMIQAVIARLASQSTTVKGWSITLTGALLGYGATTATPLLALIAAYAVLAFAALDAYYLTLERAYRALYTQAATGTLAARDLTITPPGPTAYLCALRSPANAILYGASLLITATIGGYLLTQ
jgi:hypothetical protein